MIIDSSAILADLYQETDAGYFAEAIAKATVCRTPAANFLEAAINIDTKGDSEASRQLDTLIRRTEIQIEPVTLENMCRLLGRHIRILGRQASCWFKFR